MVAAALAGVVALAAFAGCGAKDNGGALDLPPGASGTTVPFPPGLLKGKLPPSFARTGVLRVGVDQDEPPLAFMAGTQHLGVQWELAQALARALGVTMTFVSEPASDLVASVAQHRVDLAMGTVADTPATRAGGVDFVDYLHGEVGVLARQADAARAPSAQALCGSGTVGVVTGSAAAALFHPSCPAGRVLPVASFAGLLTGLGGGQLAGVADDALVVSYTAQLSAAPYELGTVGEPFGSIFYGLAVPSGDTSLRGAIESAMGTIMGDGSYAHILAKWGAGSGALVAATINGGT